MTDIEKRLDALTAEVAMLKSVVLRLLARCDPPLVKRAIRAPEWQGRGPSRT